MGEAEKTAVAAHCHIEPVVVEIDLPGSLCEVWDALTTSAGIQSSLRCAANIELRIGGPYEIVFDASQPEGKRGSETCRVLSYLPQRILSFSWNAPPQFVHAREHHTWVVVELEPIDAHQTSVRLTHLGWTERAREFPDYREEWMSARAYFALAWLRFMHAVKRALQ